MPDKRRTRIDYLRRPEDSPIAQFAVLIRGVEQGDPELIATARRHLARLGYFVAPMAIHKAEDGRWVR